MAEEKRRLDITPSEYFKLKRLMAVLEVAEYDNVKGISAFVTGCGWIHWSPDQRIGIEILLDNPDGE